MNTLLWDNPQKRIRDASVWWVAVGTWVWIERIFHQWVDINIALNATWIQMISTFFMALFCISLYEKLVETFPWDLSEDFKKICTGAAIAGLSGVVNYIWQLKTQWSYEESLAMFVIAGIWMYVYEKNFIWKLHERVKFPIMNNKKLLDFILQTSQILWLR